MAQKIVKIPDSEVTLRIFGSYDKNIRRVQDAFDVRIYNRVSEESRGIPLSSKERRRLQKWQPRW